MLPPKSGQQITQLAAPPGVGSRSPPRLKKKNSPQCSKPMLTKAELGRKMPTNLPAGR